MEEARHPPHALYRFRPVTAQALALLGVCLIMIPKMNLFPLQNGAAGLRLDDILLLSCLGLFFSVYCVFPSLGFRKIEAAFAQWLGFLLLSNFVNVVFFGRSTFLYSLRFIEYFLFFYFGYHYARRYEIRTLAKSVLWINGIVMVLQTLGVIGGFASAGYVEGVDRAIGLTGGPWEVGVLINFSLAILTFSRKVTTRFALMMFFVTTSLLLISGSRLAMLANVVIIIAFYCYKGYPIASLIWKAALVLAILAAGIVSIPNPLIERSQSLLSTENFNYLGVAYDMVPDNPRVEGFTQGWNGPALTDQDRDIGDASWLMRVFKWCAAVKLWVHDPASLLFGIGPGTVGPALDGGWLRIITETGILGLVLSMYLARSIWRISITLQIMLISMAINMLMIDIYISYKVTAFLFFTAGAMSCHVKNRSVSPLKVQLLTFCEALLSRSKNGYALPVNVQNREN